MTSDEILLEEIWACKKGQEAYRNGWPCIPPFEVTNSLLSNKDTKGAAYYWQLGWKWMRNEDQELNK